MRWNPFEPRDPAPFEPDLDPEALRLIEAVDALAKEEAGQGLEYHGKVGPGRALRRRQERSFRRMIRPPGACISLRHPLLDTLTPHGAKVLRRRRARNKVARAARKRNRR